MVVGTGRTIEEAVERALEALGLSKDDVDIEILQEPKPAILGFGGRDAKVRITRRPTVGAVAREITTQVLALMGYVPSADLAETAESATVTITDQDFSGLIGRHGHTLDALQFLVGQHVSKRLGRRVTIAVDAGGYRARREQVLVEIARRAAERAVSEGRSIALDPMDPKERRIVHLTLRDDPRVVTASEGEETSRHVIVSPRTDLDPRETAPLDEEDGAA